jgi:ATP-binding cassette subfamily B protein
MVTAYMCVNIWMTQKYIRPANLRSNRLDSEIGAVLADAIAGNAAVKSFGAEAREVARFGQTTTRWREAMTATWNRFNIMGLAQNLLLIALQAGLTALMVGRWARGEASPGDVAFAVTAFMLMSGYLRNFGEIFRAMQRGLDDTMDVAAYMRQPPQILDPEIPAAFSPQLGLIRFEGVSFRYQGQSAAVYDAFDLEIRPGERVALVGPTGAGKSTFVKLLQRLYDLDAGRITVDGVDIATVRQSELRRAIAVVPQDPALFHRTIAENIAYARPEASQDDISLAARRALAHDFITRLPKGYDTLVGERGVKLSGGERQRVAIARAFLADAPILVLDEATSSLDVETEQAVQAATEALMRGRTTLLIAHRLSTIRSADRILVFQNGRIVEDGRHGELIARGGVYARLSAVGTM